MSIGAKIRTIRKNMGLTQQRLADEVGVSRIYIQALESNRRMPSMKLLNRLAERLETTVPDMVEDLAERPRRMQLDDLLQSGEVDIWFRRHKLTEDEIKRVERVVGAVLDDWGTERKRRARQPKE